MNQSTVRHIFLRFLKIFIYFRLCWVFVALVASGGFPCAAGALGEQASVVVTHGLNCSTACLGPGLKPVSPALVSGFLTTAPPGKSLSDICLNPSQQRVTIRVTSPLSVHFPVLSWDPSTSEGCPNISI